MVSVIRQKGEGRNDGLSKVSEREGGDGPLRCGEMDLFVMSDAVTPGD